MDWLKEAKEGAEAAREMYNAVADEGARYDDECWPPDQCIQYAIAAALIAGLERKPQFVQLGHHRLCVEHISDVEDFDTGINVYLADGHVAQFRDAEKAAFLLWWNEHADVTRLDAPEAQEFDGDLNSVRVHNGTPSDAEIARRFEAKQECRYTADRLQAFEEHRGRILRKWCVDWHSYVRQRTYRRFCPGCQEYEGDGHKDDCEWAGRLPGEKPPIDCTCRWELYTINAGTYDEHTEWRREGHDGRCPVHGRNGPEWTECEGAQ